VDTSSLELVCAAIPDTEKARSLLRTRLPHQPGARPRRGKLPLKVQFAIFHKDGYIDRYSGERLVFPGVLRLLSLLMPEEFPFHPNWKVDRCHAAYWHMSPTIDHVVPIARGGADDPSNMVTTSMLRNSAKLSWTLEELGWTLLPRGNEKAWDGLTRWFLRYTEDHPSGHLKQMRAALVAAQGKND